MKTNKDEAIEVINDLAKDLHNFVGAEIEVDYCEEFNGNLLCIKGKLTTDAIEHDSGNKIEGYWESFPYDYVTEWSFSGVVTVEDLESNLIETIDISDKDFE